MWMVQCENIHNKVLNERIQYIFCVFGVIKLRPIYNVFDSSNHTFILGLDLLQQKQTIEDNNK